MYDRHYDRKFIMLKQEDGGYNHGDRVVSGNITIELKNGKGKISVYVQGLKTLLSSSYRLCLIKAANTGAIGVLGGPIQTDAKGKGELKWEFDPNNVSGSHMPIEDFNVFAVIVKNNKYDNLIAPLCGYIENEIHFKNQFQLFSAKEESEKKGISEESEKRTPKEKEPKKEKNVEPEMVIEPKSVEVESMATTQKMEEAKEEAVPSIAESRQMESENYLDIQMDTPQEIPIEEPIEIPQEIPIETPIEIPQEIPMDTPMEIPQEIPMETPIEIPQEIPMDTPIEIPQEIPMDTPMEIPKEAPAEEPLAIQEDTHEKTGEMEITEVKTKLHIGELTKEEEEEIFPDEKNTEFKHIPFYKEKEVESMSASGAKTAKEQNDHEGHKNPHEKFKNLLQDCNKKMDEIDKKINIAQEEILMSEDMQKDCVNALSLESLFKNNPPMKPFAAKEEMEWVRIYDKELSLLPMSIFRLMNHPFTSSSYRKFNHFILGKKLRGEGLFFGVPDAYQDIYQTRAASIGFKQFRCCSGDVPVQNEYGYWIMEI